MNVYNSIQMLKLNVDNDLDSKKFAELVDSIKNGLIFIEGKSGFDILSLHSSNIVDFIKSIKINEDNTVENVLESKQEVNSISNTEQTTYTKKQIKSRRKQTILNRDSLLTTKAINIYKEEIKKMKKQKTSQVSTALMMGAQEMIEVIESNVNNSIVIFDN